MTKVIPRYKISVFGESIGVGRSSLVNALIGSEFEEDLAVPDNHIVCL